MGTRFAIMTNSGSSANLLALSALTSPLLGSNALKVGDEVITVAAGFPTTVNPIIQAGLVPVFVDINIGTYNVTPHLVDQAITEKTRAIFIAHTLGNPYDIDEIKEIAKLHNLWVIEDVCDAIGSEFDGRKVGTFGNLSTTSFYPAHIMAVGEGGMVFTDSPMVAKAVRSFRDWGRDCWCLPGKDNTCGKRFGQTCQGDLPDGFDHKYIFSHIGYNLKSTDLQAAIGLEQLKKLPEFLEDRRQNWEYLREQFKQHGLDKYFILPTQLQKAKPAWFGFLLTIRESASFSRNELVRYLEDKRIGSRNLFGGNLTKQPAYLDKNWRIADIVSGLPHTDIIMERTFWIGCHPNMTKSMLDYIVKMFVQFVTSHEK
jgi:CDP-6-deoxy-D-xylo-4-hexulose-3-dehydrase